MLSKSKFKQDLSSEIILSQYLDCLYQKKKYPIRRVSDLNSQHKGIDLVYTKDGKDFFIDEKAQLHYLNCDIPTFTFELSYLNTQNKLRQGWLFDEHKKTHWYFIITGIMLEPELKELKTPKDIKSLKLMVVDRVRLKWVLNDLGLNKVFLQKLDIDIRSKNSYGKNRLSMLDSKKEGTIYYTEHLKEKPMNLQLRLSFLLESKVAKRIC